MEGNYEVLQSEKMTNEPSKDLSVLIVFMRMIIDNKDCSDLGYDS